MAVTTTTLTRPVVTEWRWTPPPRSSYDDLSTMAKSIAALHELAITSTPSYAEIKNQAARVAGLVK